MQGHQELQTEPDHSTAVPVVPLNRVDLFVVILLTLVVLIAGGAMLVSPCGLALDDGIYASTAKALACGQGYRLINLPGAPLQKRYPILYPLLLSIVWRLDPNFDSNVMVMKWLSVIFGALTVSLTYLYLVRWRYANRLCAFAGALICSLCVYYLEYATLPLTEAPFAFFNVAAIWILERYVRQQARPTKLAQILTGCALGVPFLWRTAGVILLPAALALIARARRPLCLVMLGAALTMGPWVAWQFAHDSHANSMTQQQNQDYQFAIKRSARLASVFIPRNFFHELSAAGLILIDDGEKPNPIALAARILAVCLSALTWFFIGKDLRRISALSTAMASYFAMIVLCPWPVNRYLVPLLPIFSVLMMVTIAKLLSRVVKEKGCATTITILAIGAVWSNALDAARKVTMDRSHGMPSAPHFHLTTYWSSYEDLFQWVREHTPADCLLAAPLDSMLYLYTDRLCIRPVLPNPAAIYYQLNEQPFEETLEQLHEKLVKQHVDYLVCAPYPSAGEDEPFQKYVDQFKLTYPGELIPVYEGSDNRFIVYKFAPSH
jgi:4-amino-4-deoxy-L-arabinose transferase-like glycosyltransferase